MTYRIRYEDARYSEEFKTLDEAYKFLQVEMKKLRKAMKFETPIIEWIPDKEKK